MQYGENYSYCVAKLTLCIIFDDLIHSDTGQQMRGKTDKTTFESY